MIYYRVQIGAYILKNRANKICADLIEKGFKTTMPKEGLLYKVRIGSFQDKKKAEKLLAKVKTYDKYKNAKIMTWDDGKTETKPTDVSPVNTSFHPKFKMVGIWLSRVVSDKFGDATVFIEYGEDGETITHAVLIDTGQSGSYTVRKLKELGITFLDAVIITHCHGDHYGYLTTILDVFQVKALYLPNVTGVKKYQPSYATAIYNQEKKAKAKKIPVTYMAVNKTYQFGNIDIWCIFQSDEDDLPEHDNHHFINNMSMAFIVTLDSTGRVLMTGDLSDDGNAQFMTKFKDFFAIDICNCGWHGDPGAMSDKFAKWVNAFVWWWSYEKTKARGQRPKTIKSLKAAGVLDYNILGTTDDGDIVADFQVYDSHGHWCVTTTKTNKKINFQAKMSA